MNVRLLRRVMKHISADPKRFAMDYWMQKANECPAAAVRDTGGHEHEFPKCGTAACIGGWATILTAKSRITSRTDFEKNGQKALGLTHDQKSRLFDVWGWPAQFRRPYNFSATAEDRVKIAVARIEHFIKTKGAE